MSQTYKSVYESQHDIIQAIMALHTGGKIDCDITYGNGKFYSDIEKPLHRFDLDPQTPCTQKACSTNVPLPDSSLKSIMFDPPFLTYIKKQRGHNSVMAKRFGGYWNYVELEEHYQNTADEASRLLQGGGVFVVKCQDIIHNHKMHCTHANMINWCADAGFRLLDLFVLPAKHRMPMPGKNRKQQHARIHHSYFLVFKKVRP